MDNDLFDDILGNDIIADDDDILNQDIEPKFDDVDLDNIELDLTSDNVDIKLGDDLLSDGEDIFLDDSDDLLSFSVDEDDDLLDGSDDDLLGGSGDDILGGDLLDGNDDDILDGDFIHIETPKPEQLSLDQLLNQIRSVQDTEVESIEIPDSYKVNKNINLFDEFIRLSDDLDKVIINIKSSKSVGNVTENKSMDFLSLNADPHDLFIDGNNYFSQLVAAFRRYLINTEDDYESSIEEFLESDMPEEISLKLPPYQRDRYPKLIDILRDDRSVDTLVVFLQEMKERNDQTLRVKNNMESVINASANHVIDLLFEGYELTFDVNNLLTKLLRKIDNIYNQMTDEERTELKTLASTSNRFEYGIILEQIANYDERKGSIYFDFMGTEYEFALPVSYSPFSGTYKCACGHENEMTVPFMSTVFIPDYRQRLPGINVCEKCGAYNFLLETGLNKTRSSETVPQNVNEFIKSNSDGARFNAMLYIEPKSEVDTIPDEVIEKEEIEFNPVELNSAISRYFSKSSAYKQIDASDVDSVELVGKFFIGEYDKSYKVFYSAINSVIYHLENDSFGIGSLLKHSSLAYYDAVLDSTELLNHLRELTQDPAKENEFNAKMAGATQVLGMYYGRDYKFNHTDIKLIEKRFKELEEEREEFILTKNDILSDLDKNIVNLGNLHIAPIKISDDMYKDYMCDDKVRSLIIKWAFYMVIYRNIKSYIEFKEASKQYFTKDKFLDNLKINEQIFSYLEEKRFKGMIKAHDLIPRRSIYPSPTYNTIMNIASKIKKAYNKDFYDYCVTLNQLLQEVIKVQGVDYEGYPVSSELLCGLSEGLVHRVIDRLNNFFNSYPTKEYFYLGKQFTKEEISSSDMVKRSNIKWAKVMPKRQDGETLNQYMENLHNQDANIAKEFIECDYSIVPEIRQVSVLVDSIYLTSMWAFDSQSFIETNKYYIGKFLVDTILNNKLGKLSLTLLEYSDEKINQIINKLGDYKDKFEEDEYEEFRYKSYMSSIVYRSPEINYELKRSYEQATKVLSNLKDYVEDTSEDMRELLTKTSIKDGYSDASDVYYAELANLNQSKRDKLIAYLNEEKGE